MLLCLAMTFVRRFLSQMAMRVCRLQPAVVSLFTPPPTLCDPFLEHQCRGIEICGRNLRFRNRLALSHSTLALPIFLNLVLKHNSRVVRHSKTVKQQCTNSSCIWTYDHRSKEVKSAGHESSDRRYRFPRKCAQCSAGVKRPERMGVTVQSSL